MVFFNSYSLVPLCLNTRANKNNLFESHRYRNVSMICPKHDLPQATLAVEPIDPVSMLTIGVE